MEKIGLAVEETVDGGAEFDDMFFDLLHLVSQFLVCLLEIFGIKIEAKLADTRPSLEESVVCGLKEILNSFSTKH